jgi:hypothetical protein
MLCLGDIDIVNARNSNAPDRFIKIVYGVYQHSRLLVQYLLPLIIDLFGHEVFGQAKPEQIISR